LFEIPGTGINLTGCYSYDVAYISHNTIIVKKPFFAPDKTVLAEVAKQIKSLFPQSGKGGDCFGFCKDLLHIDTDMTPTVTQTKKVLLWDVTVTVTLTIHVRADAKICCGNR
jgi:hypothetical protein